MAGRLRFGAEMRKFGTIKKICYRAAVMITKNSFEMKNCRKKELTKKSEKITEALKSQSLKKMNRDFAAS